MFGDCQVLSSMASMAEGYSSADALFASPLLPILVLSGFMSLSSVMPLHHFFTTLIHKEDGVMGGLHMTKHEAMDLHEIDMELGGGSGNGHLDGLLSFADVDNDCKDQKHVMLL